MDPERIREKTPIKPREPEPKPAEKQQPSSFDRVLEQTRMMQQAPVMQQQSSRQGQEDAQREARREARPERRRETHERREKGQSSSSGERVSREKGEEGPTHRIVAKTTLKREQGGGGQSGQGGAGGYGGHGAKRDAAVTRMRAESRATIAQQVGQQRFMDQLKMSRMPERFTAQQVQQLVNKMVQFIRIGRTRIGADDLHMGLNETVFRGLNLRLSAKGGTVSIQFVSPHAEVRALFERESRAIASELESKGVRVAKIDVLDIG